MTKSNIKPSPGGLQSAAAAESSNERTRALNLIIICTVLAALLAMFGGSFIYRLSHPSLVKPVRLSEGASPQQGFGGEEEAQAVSPEAMQHIVELMGQLRDNPDSYPLRLDLAEHFIEISNWKSAIPHLEKALALKPDALQPYNYLGYSHFSLGEYDEAARYYSESARIFNDASAKLNLAFIYKNYLQRPDEADQLFDEVIAAPDTDEELRAVARSLKTDGGE